MEHNCIWILDMDFVHFTQQLGIFSYVFENLSQGTNVSSLGFKIKYSCTKNKFTQLVKPMKILFLWRSKILHHLASYLTYFTVRERYIIMWLLVHTVVVNYIPLLLAYVRECYLSVIIGRMVASQYQYQSIFSISVPILSFYYSVAYSLAKLQSLRWKFSRVVCQPQVKISFFFFHFVLISNKMIQWSIISLTRNPFLSNRDLKYVRDVLGVGAFKIC